MSITLSGESWSISLQPPLQEYTVEYQWAVAWNELRSCYKARDNGIKNDYITCKNIKFWVNRAASEVLSELILDPDYMRGELFTLELGSTPSGIYPGSPLYGDVGSFGVKIIDIVEPAPGILMSPFNYFEYTFTFAICTFPVYIIPNMEVDGLISIGSLTSAFRWPLDGFNPRTAQGLVNVRTNGGQVYPTDSGRNTDLITTEFTCEGSAGNTGRLLDYLRSVRGYAFNLGVHENYYPFGANLTDTSYSVSCVNEKFEITHDRFNNFKIPLKLWRR